MGVLLKKTDTKHLVLLFLLAFLFLAASLGVFLVDSSRELSTKFGDDNQGEDFVKVFVEAISVDPIDGKMEVRVELFPKGEYQAEENFFSQNTYMFVNNMEGEAEYEFIPDRPLTNTMITLHFVEGDVIHYPFDRHESYFVLDLGMSDDEKNWGVPIILEFRSSLMGYRVEVFDENVTEIEDGYLDFGIAISRTLPVMLFVVFVIVIQWLLAMAALLITFSALTRKTAVDIRMSSWFAAMLFALPALRRSVPEVPPLGVLYDYLSFFWVEGVVALCLAVYVLLWYFRKDV